MISFCGRNDIYLASTPFRVSFLGGGSDYPEWYAQERGAVLSVAIDYRSHILIRNMQSFFGYNLRCSWSKIETCDRIHELENPVVRAVLTEYYNGVSSKGPSGPLSLDIHHIGDLPARSGIGSSSAFTVSMLNAIHYAYGVRLSEYELATRAIHIEREVLSEAGGIQDQIQVAYGGLNLIEFWEKEFVVTPVKFNQEVFTELEKNCLLFFTGISRNSFSIAADKRSHLAKNNSVVRSMVDLVDHGLKALNGCNLQLLAELLDESWQLKRSLSVKVSSTEIDALYDTAKKNGAIGGKILGAGGGGFFLVMAPPDHHDGIRRGLSKYKEVPFKISMTGATVRAL